MSKTPKSLTFLYWLLYFCAIASIILHFWYWIDPVTFKTIGHNPLVDLFVKPEKLFISQRIAGFFIGVVPLILLVYAFIYLARAIIHFKELKQFDASIETHFRKAGFFALGYVMATILHRPLMSVAMTWFNEPGERMLHIGFRSSDAIALIPALMALVVAHMISIARQNQEELRKII